MKILLVGALGRMGKNIINLCKERDFFVYGYDKEETVYEGFQIYNDLTKIPTDYVGIVDFSHFTLTKIIATYAANLKKPLVLATTGLTEEILLDVKKISNKIPIFQSANLAIGMYIFQKLVADAASMLKKYDIEIIDRHHNKKVDAPSGTALMLYETIKEKKKDAYPVYDRHELDQKRTTEEIGISSIRGGNIIGDHTVLFIGSEETIELTHRATSRLVFASGAIDALKFVLTKKTGFYELKDLIKGEEGND